MSQLRYQFTGRVMPLQKLIKQGGHFGVLTGMWIFQNITYRVTNSAKSQVKIRLAFHVVERNYNERLSDKV